jgi:hypothetical protein
MVNRRAFFALFPIFTALLLSGCLSLPDFDTSQEANQEILPVEFDEGVTIGQTLTARRARLNGLTFWVNRNVPVDAGQAWVTVRLFRSPEEAAQREQPLYSSQIPVSGSGPIGFSFPPRSEPAGQGYYMELTPSDASVLFQGQTVDAYGGGTAYVRGSPVSGDLAFRSTYDFNAQAVLSDLLQMAGQSWLLFPLAMILLAPGWLMLDLSGLRRRFDTGEQVALSSGLSLAFLPLLMLWTSTFELRWSREYLLIVSILLALVVLWRALRGPRPARLDWISLLLAGVFIFALGVRLMMVRDLVAPAWVDSVHHALITKLILDDGALPSSYSPYLQLSPTVYHLGFHSVLALFIWLSGLDLMKGMLLYGQVLNAACVFAVYLLTTLLTGDRRAGLGAALLCGLFTPMPAYYVSWGRYTQLAGLLIMPVPLAFIRLIFEEETKPHHDMAPSPVETRLDGAESDDGSAQRATQRTNIKRTIGKWAIPLSMASISSAGLLLVHYRAAAFLACLLLAYSISLFFDRRRLSRLALGTSVKQILAAGSLLILGTYVFTMPWMSEVIREHLLPAFTPGNVVPTEAFADFSWRLLNAGYGVYTLWLAGLGLLLGMALRKRFVISIIIWVSMLFVLSNLNALGLPGGEMINNTSVAITLFMPISLFGGYALSRLVYGGEWLLLRRVTWTRLQVPYQIGLVGAGIVLSFAGARQLFPLVNQSTYLFRSADRPALAWVERNVPQDEVILINPFNWGYGLCAGNDGGAWISALSGQPTQPPPVLYGFGERSEIQRVNDLCAHVMQHGGNPDELWAMMYEAGLRYIYVGARGGPLSPTALFWSPLFDTLYAENGAYVFRSLGW